MNANLARINELCETLASATDAAKASDIWQSWLKTQAQFHSYSAFNTILIYLQKPNAELIAGYNQWQNKFERHVKKGARAIHILAPVSKKIEDENGDEDTKIFFRDVCVFDVSDTDGKPLPTKPAWRSFEKNEALRSALLKFAALKGIQVSIESFGGRAAGFAIDNQAVLKPESGDKTLVHEIAHILLGHTKQLQATSKKMMEWQADSVSAIVLMHFGMDVTANVNYLVSWQAEGKDVKNVMASVRNVAAEIINAIETEMVAA